MPSELALCFAKVLDDSDVADLYSHSLEVSIPAVGLSLIDGTPNELFRFSLNEIKLEATACRSGKDTFSFSIDRMQIDDGAATPSIFPVLMYATPQKPITEVVVDKKTGKERTKTLPFPPVIQLSAIRRSASPGVTHFQWLSVLIQELDIAIPQEWFFKLFEFLNEINLDAGYARLLPI